MLHPYKYKLGCREPGWGGILEGGRVTGWDVGKVCMQEGGWGGFGGWYWVFSVFSFVVCKYKVRIHFKVASVFNIYFYCLQSLVKIDCLLVNTIGLKSYG